ncbi:MAG: diphthamide synthesis protein [Nanoarchaeota archaeon]
MYKIDMETVISEIKKNKAKRVMIQLPNGLRPRAKEITDTIRKETRAEVVIWAGSAYGACDIPIGTEKLGIDITFHFGHSAWRK